MPPLLPYKNGGSSEKLRRRFRAGNAVYRAYLHRIVVPARRKRKVVIVIVRAIRARRLASGPGVYLDYGYLGVLDYLVRLILPLLRRRAIRGPGVGRLKYRHYDGPRINPVADFVSADR